MNILGFIGITVKGKSETGKEITRLDVDISEIKNMISDIETFLYPSRNEKADRPLISYQLEDGSARHKFILPITAVITFNALISEIAKRKSLDFLEYRRAEVIDKFQHLSKAKNWEIQLNSSIPDGAFLSIDKDSAFYNIESAFIETEMYLYGEIYQEGGINPNLHIETKEYGRLIISATKEQIIASDIQMYHTYGVRVSGKQNLADGKPFELTFIEIVHYSPKYDENNLNALITKARPNLSQINDVDVWLNNIRGGGDV